MKRSIERILTTHTGSLPRPPQVVELMLQEQNNPGAKAAELKAAVRRAVADVVAKQVACGLDVINDGEQGRTDYTTHVKDRLTGFDGPSSPPLGTGEPDFPELSAMLAYFASPFQHRPACSGPVKWKDFAALEAAIALAKAATAGAEAADVFFTSPSPGQIARYLKNQHYPSEEAYLYALADVMAREYRAIVDAGLVLQLDCPDLALSRHMGDRIVQYARVVGAENVIAGVDCGFGTFAGRVQVGSKIVWMKLASLAEGARLASKELW